MITPHKFIHQYRVARLIMIVVIVGLTIFLYTSYCANQTIQRLLSAQQLQMSSMISLSAALDDVENGGIIAVATRMNPKAKANNIPIASPSSNVMAGGKLAEEKLLLPSSAKASAPAASNVRANNLDTTKSIRTSDLYESGHTDANSDLCGNDAGEHLRLLILITSAPTHEDARLAIRQTWGQYSTRSDIAIAFMLGATMNQSTEDSLDAESYIYSDLIRGRFIDSFDNLTLKTISLLEWVDTYCSRVPFVLKTDDDMFINVPLLMSFIEKHRNDKRIIFGRLADKWKPILYKRSKYYVSPKLYIPWVFPQYTTGRAYLMSSDVVHDLYTKSLTQTYLKLEDAYITGVVAQAANVERRMAHEFLNIRIAFDTCSIRRAISVHGIGDYSPTEQETIFEKFMDTNVTCEHAGIIEALSLNHSP